MLLTILGYIASTVGLHSKNCLKRKRGKGGEEGVEEEKGGGGSSNFREDCEGGSTRRDMGINAQIVFIQCWLLRGPEVVHTQLREAGMLTLTSIPVVTANVIGFKVEGFSSS